ncbi:hypothetical protein GCM10023210_34900 [Chryseobacterium ginsengisoli]|uniref:Uncharacterized protein n=1 Tax=Chryseobacterium ginsengisoli TaxID=363853 RepID=A0ABP9MP83_9FLAO
MVEFLIIVAVLLGISNFYFFLFFRRNDKKRKSKIFFGVIFSLTVLLDIILIIKNSDSFAYKALENILFLLLINILIPGYFLMLWGINSLLENILIIRGYFSYNVIFSILILTSTMLYYFLGMMILSFNYFQ